MSIGRFMGVGLGTFSGTGDFGFIGIINPLWKMVEGTILLRSDCQPCKHPEAHLAAHAPISVLELRSAGEGCSVAINGYHCKYLVCHWNATISGEKVLLWEQFQLSAIPGQLTDDAGNLCYEEQREIWLQHGYFNLETWAEQQKEKQRQALAVKIRAGLSRAPSAATPAQKDPLFLPTLEVLESAFRYTAKNTLAKNEEGKLAAFEFEAHHPSGEVNMVDYHIVRLYRLAVANKTPPPSDKEIAAELYDLIKVKITPHAVKLRRQGLRIHGGNRGPRP